MLEPTLEALIEGGNLLRPARCLVAGRDPSAAPLRPVAGVDVVVSGEIAGDVRTATASLAFRDGSFDAVVAPATPADGPLREIQRVLRPGGVVAFPSTNGRDGDLLARLRRLGFEGPRRADVGTASIVMAEREASVTTDVWKSLDRPSAAASWNDDMFLYRQTPYDPWTIAGQIFLARVRWFARNVSANPSTRVLEIGCEAGGLLRKLPDGPFVVGLDVSGEALRAAQGDLAERGHVFVQADATGPLPFPDRSFDVVISSEMLEHCRSPHRVVATMHRLVRPDGRVLVSVPNERHYLIWKSWLRKLPVLRWALRGIEEGAAAWHLHHDFDRGKIRSLVEGWFEVETEKTILGTTLVYSLKPLPPSSR